MSEIRDKVREKMIEALQDYDPKAPIDIPCPHCDIADKILSIPELAVVNRKAKLPENPYNFPIPHIHEAHSEVRSVYNLAQQDMLKEKWVKEVGKEAQEKIAEVVNSHWWHEIDDNQLLEKLAELGYRRLKGDPPLLSDEEIATFLAGWEGELMLDIGDMSIGHFRKIAEAQREADIAYYMRDYEAN